MVTIKNGKQEDKSLMGFFDFAKYMKRSGWIPSCNTHAFTCIALTKDSCTLACCDCGDDWSFVITVRERELLRKSFNSYRRRKRKKGGFLSQGKKIPSMLSVRFNATVKLNGEK